MSGSIFAQVSVFAGVAAEPLARLAAAAEERRLRPNAVVFRQGDPCDGLYLVTSGGVVIRSEVVGQPIERVRDLAPGDLFGEIEALGGSPRLFTARALGATSVLRLPPEPLAAFLAGQPAVEARLRGLSVQRRTSRLRALLAPSTRREPRIRMDREVRLAPQGGSPVRARLEDLSAGGACLSAAPPAWEAGREVAFALGTEAKHELIHLRGQVRWRQDGLVGIAFETGDPGHRRQIERAIRELLPAPAR